MEKTRILFLSEENEIVSFLEDVLRNVNGYEVRETSEQTKAIELFGDFSPLIAVINLDRPYSAEFFKSLKKDFPNTCLLGFAQKTESVNNSIRNCFDKILSHDELRVRFMTEILDFQKQSALFSSISGAIRKIVGHSRLVENMVETIFKAIRSKGATVLIQGESGTGKELVAKAIASASSNLVSVNCSAISENLFESELFGHARGAFTGALGDRKGLFEVANGGVLFLDEVGDIPLSMQAKLLRTLQEGEIRPVGSNETKKVKVQIIAATNHDLQDDSEKGLFRKDLYYRLNVIPIYVPPLRERKEDIPELARHFIREYALPTHPNPRLSEATLKKLCLYDWPGNIRELENAIHRALVLMDGDEISPEHLFPSPIRSLPEIPFHNWASVGYKEFQTLQKNMERDFIIAKLKENDGSVTKTAKLLGMQRPALYAHAARIGLDIKSIREK